MSMSHRIIKSDLLARMAVLKAQWRAAQTLMKPGQCLIEVTDPYYRPHEELQAQLWELEDNE